MKEVVIKQEHITLALTALTGFFIVFCGFLLYYLMQERQKNEDLIWENETLQEDLDEMNDRLFEALNPKQAEKINVAPNTEEE